MIKWTSQRWLVGIIADLSALPVSIWVRLQERRICRSGTALSPMEQSVARLAGVRFPEKVRVLGVEEVPFPFDRVARKLASWSGRFPQRALGLTARYGIYLQNDSRTDVEILVHELVHTGQYERLNGILGFLRAYIRDCLINGYYAAGMEQEARDVSFAALSRDDTCNGDHPTA